MAKGANTIAAATHTAQSVGKVHEWPPTAGQCTGEAWAIYVENQKFRAFDDWPSSDLIELAKVSKMQAIVFAEMDIMESEGLIVLGGKTGLAKVENPRNRAINTLNGAITSTMRRLAITSASSADRETKAKRAQNARKVEAETRMDRDSLI